jgi:hypothetical protein
MIDKLFLYICFPNPWWVYKRILKNEAFMDSLAEIIKTFSEESIKDFKIFINRERKIKDRKDLELFNVLLKNPNAGQEEIIHAIYGKNNVEAYHALRKYLTRQITQYIMVTQMQNDQSAAAGISGLISISRYMFDYKSYKTAWKHLKKAEDLASSNEHYELLQQIYNVQLQFSDMPFAPDLKEIIRKHKENKAYVDQDEKGAIAFGIIKKRLNEFRLTGKNIQFEEITRQIIGSYDLEQDIYSRPRLFYQIMSLFRSAVIAKKDYYTFEPFIIKNYQRFLLKTGFKPKDNIYKSSLLYMIAQTLYRNKKFDDAQKYLAQLKDILDQMPQVHSIDLLIKHYLLFAATDFFSGKKGEAIALLQQVNESTILGKNIPDALNLKLNLGFYLLYDRNAPEANKILMNIAHSNNRCEKIMGKEWVLKKDILETLVQYDLGNDDIALNKIRSVERTYDFLKENEQYQRVLVFLQLCRKLFLNPHDAKTPEFYSHVDTSFDWIPMQQEDLQAVMYYAWFKSKMTEQAAYETLLNLTRNIDAN